MRHVAATAAPTRLFDDDDHLENALALHERLDPVADLHRRRRLGCGAIYADMAASAAGRRGRTGLIDPDGPQPQVYPSRVDGAIVPA